MPITYDIKQDKLYNKGIEQGIKQGIEQGVEQERERVRKEKIQSVCSLLELGSLTEMQIANILNVSEAFVMEIKQGIK